MTANLFIIRASRGMCSQISRPGTSVGSACTRRGCPGGVGLEVEHVLVRRAPRQEDHDHRLVRTGHAGRRLGLKQLRQRQAAQGQAAEPEEIAPGHPVTVATCTLAQNGQHGRVPSTGERCVRHAVYHWFVHRLNNDLARHPKMQARSPPIVVDCCDRRVGRACSCGGQVAPGLVRLGSGAA